MRLRHPDGSVVHLSYGTNVHPAESVDGLLAQLTRFAEPVRRALDVPRLGLGLWLPAEAAGPLAADPRELDRLRTALDRAGLEVVTLNAFPYAGFHAPVVKQAVYHPDWTERGRLGYTLDCARVLAALLPDDAERGSISTLPLAWRDPWDDARQSAARKQLDELAEGLAALGDRTGRTVRVALEPEPGCVVETAADAVDRLAGVDTDHLGVCLDLCHLATEFEDPAGSAAALGAAGLPVVKTQLSAAVHADDPRDPATREALGRFAEDRFLHQVRELGAGGTAPRDDLPEALAGDAPLPGDGPWRVHFHVPLHARPDAPLRSTTDVLVEGMRALVGGAHPLVDHLEVETYTWGVLPAGQRPTDDAALVAGLAAELAWSRDRLVELGLEAL